MGTKRSLVKDLIFLHHEGVELAQVLRRRRAELGLSQADLAAVVGVDKRQIRRYEAGEQQPVLGVAVAIANALGVSLSDLAGLPTPEVDLGGRWWAAWQTFKEEQEVVTSQEVNLHQQGDGIQVHALTRGIEVEEGGYLWRGELRLWDSEVLMGWYAADDGATRSKGTMYFVLHPHGLTMRGRWVGLNYDGAIVTGWGAMARDREEEARKLIRELEERGALTP
jgi:transcriptional regulator with XRE-family HTH domain